jgi:solute carrier family 25 (mitochondrial carnitine/acylcarnitine transporter), member 20/29
VTKELTPKDLGEKSVPIYVPIMAGGIGGTSYWVFNYPFDYVKTLMQSDALGNFRYPTMMSCFRDQFKLGGYSTFFKGYGICLMRSFPVNAAAVTVYRAMQTLTGAKSH